jgi:predicted  nucleic acid-binding Zn-ribbon protein
MSTERDSLEIHVDLCELRYKQLDDRMTRVENKVTEINVDLQDFKAEMRRSFDEVKAMLSQARDQKFNTIIGAASGIVVALLGMMGYIITHLPN